MSSKRDLNLQHRCRFETCKGTLAEHPSKYGVWAYWRGAKSGGWWSTP